MDIMMKSLIFYLALLSPLSVLAANPHATCQNGVVSKDGLSLPLTDVLDSNHLCAKACPGETSQPVLCQRIVDMVLPGGFNTTKADLYSIPHRGSWGMNYPLGKTESENTPGAFFESFSQNKFYIEADVALTGSNGKEPALVFVGHYFDMVSVNGPAGADPKDYIPSQFKQFKMRHRDQTPNYNDNARTTLVGELLEFAKKHQMVVFFDPKIPKKNPSFNEYQHIVAVILREAEARDALPNIIIKTTDNPTDAIIKMVPWISQSNYDRYYRGRFLWNPISEVFPGKAKEDVLTYIDNWIAATGKGKQIATLETGLFTPTDWSANSFSWKGASYVNIIHYMYKGNGFARKRTGIWHIDPMSPRGSFGLTYRSRMIGNTKDDKRGDIPLTLLSPYISTVAVTTNRPELWDSIISN